MFGKALLEPVLKLKMTELQDICGNCNTITLCLTLLSKKQIIVDVADAFLKLLVVYRKKKLLKLRQCSLI